MDETADRKGALWSSGSMGILGSRTRRLVAGDLKRRGNEALRIEGEIAAVEARRTAAGKFGDPSLVVAAFRLCGFWQAA
jgi:hypothetical protein